MKLKGRKQYYKKFKELKDRDQKYSMIIEYLKNVSSPVDGKKISEDLQIPYEEVDVIIQCKFMELTNEATRSGIADPDFYIIGDNIEKICDNFYYKTVKSRLSIGQKAWSKTGGILR